MKFLCVPCDSPMTLQTVDPPDRGSLSIVYACPACGYEIAMLTNAYETQVVQSLGVRIGAAEAGAANGQRANAGSSGGCPFAAMIPAKDGAVRTETRPTPNGEAILVEAIPVSWTEAAEARLANIPAFVRPMCGP